MQERGFGGGNWNSCFCLLSQNFFAGIPAGQEFVFAPDSSGFLFPPEAVWLRPATKEGLFSKIWTKTALF